MPYIELVIKIPEEKYDYVKKQVAEGIDNPLKVYIANGIPLQKGHGRLKDIDKVERLLDLENPDNAIAKALKNIMESIPTIIEADTESEE